MSKDFWTNGGYSKVVNDYFNSANTYTGGSGYSLAQTQAMVAAKQIARDRVNQGILRAQQGNTAATNAAQSVQASTNAVSPDQYDMFKQLNNARMKSREKLAAEQAERAKSNASLAQSGVQALMDAGQGLVTKIPAIKQNIADANAQEMGFGSQQEAQDVADSLVFKPSGTYDENKYWNISGDE